MHLTRLHVLAIVVLAAAACSGSGSGTRPADPGASTAGPSSLAPATRVAVRLTDALRMEPAAFAVPHGMPVTFVVTNAGAIEHEFFLGDEAAQTTHEHEMAGMGGMTNNAANVISMKPGETKELTFMFAQGGVMLAGCHVPGHYPGGMKAQITVS